IEMQLPAHAGRDAGELGSAGGAHALAVELEIEIPVGQITAEKDLAYFCAHKLGAGVELHLLERQFLDRGKAKTEMGFGRAGAVCRVDADLFWETQPRVIEQLKRILDRPIDVA